MERVFTEELKLIFEDIIISLASKNRLFLGSCKSHGRQIRREYYEFHLNGIHAAKNIVFLYDRDDLKNEVVALSRLNDLDELNLIKVASCDNYSIAFDIENNIYVWGVTLENGLLINNKKKIFEMPPEMKIIDVQCGAAHALILTECGYVFAFGNNKFKQCGDDTGGEYISKPTAIKNLTGIKSISCGKYHSVALGTDGLYGWGSNKYKQIDPFNRTPCVKNPRLLNFSLETKKYNKICCGPRHTWLLYDNDKLLALGDNRNGQLGASDISLNLNKLPNFSDVLSHYSYDSTIAKINDSMHIWGSYNSQDFLNSSSFEDLCNIISNKYSRNIETTSCLILIYEYIFDLTINCLNENRLTFIKSNFYQNGKQNNEFENFENIGSGSFGHVFKVYSKLENNYYALKEITLEKDYLREFLKEIITSPMILDINSNFIITYYDIWLEELTILNNQVMKLYILMELADYNLEDVIKNIQNTDYLFSNGRLTTLGFYLALNLFTQILHGVRDLHGSNLIHKDLKPPNIMLKNNRDSYVIKIADFGLVAYHQCDENCNVSPCSLKNGTEYYKAPEMRMLNAEYTHKVDIYSLGLIFMELFTTEYYTTTNMNDYNYITKLCERMQSIYNLSTDPSSIYSYQDEFLEICKQMLDGFKADNRPDCIEIIRNFEDIMEKCNEEATLDFRDVKDKIDMGELDICDTYLLLANIF